MKLPLYTLATSDRYDRTSAQVFASERAAWLAAIVLLTARPYVGNEESGACAERLRALLDTDPSGSHTEFYELAEHYDEEYVIELATLEISDEELQAAIAAANAS